MSEFAGRISRPRPERAGVCNATRLATRLPNGLSPAAENDYALSLNGVDQYVDCGTGIGDALGDNYAGDLTVSMWFKADATSGSVGLFSISAFGSSSGPLNIRFNSDSLDYRLNVSGWVRAVAFTDTTNWNHLACVYKGGSEADSKMYLNGVPTGATSGTFPSSSDMDLDGLKTVIGGYYSASYVFDGNIDECAIWSAALSADAVTAVYNSGRPIDLNYGRGDYANSADLVSWWRMGDINLGGGDTVPDAAGSNDGTLVNDPAYTVDNPPNYSDWALGFDGVDQYADAALTLNTGSYTISSWLKWDSTGGAFPYWFDHREGEVDAIAVYLQESGGKLRALVYQNETTHITASYDMDVDVWTHLCLVKDGATFNLYKDGILWGTVGSIGSEAQGTAFRLGSRYTNSNYFEGEMDEVGLWDTVALTSSQVNDIYNGGTPAALALSPTNWWRMGEDNSGEGYTVTDMGSESDDLTLYNTPTFERSVPAADASWNNRSIEFDGVDQYVDLGTSSTLNPANITIAMWVKPGALTDWDYLFTRGQADYNEAYRFEVGSANLYASFGNGSSNGNISKAHGMSNGTWYHVALTYDGATATLFLDGASIGTESISIVMEQATRTTTIGQPLTSHGGYFDGQIDSVGLWSRALTAAQILEIYNGGIPFDLSGHLPVAWYRMGDLDNPGGGTIRDFGINLAPPSEQITNGDFATDSDWVKGTGWTISGGSASSDGSQSGNSNLKQVAGLLTGNILYEITFTVSDYSAGNVRTVLGGSAVGTNRNANGSYTQVLTIAGGSNFFIQADTDFVGSIDDVSVKQVLYGNPGALQNSPTWTTDTP